MADAREPEPPEGANYPYRAAQEESSASLEPFVQLFENSDSGQGAKRVECLTHDTRRALIQTMNGLTALCKLLFIKGFKYVLLRELQSDRIEDEFSVYRQSTGANAFMQARDAYTAFKCRLARFAATYLESLEGVQHDVNPHNCYGIEYDDAKIMEVCAIETTLSVEEENACAYVAGWLEKKCKDKLSFSEEDPEVDGDVRSFIEELSKGALTVPHISTYNMMTIQSRKQN
ncbi:hypothetical protein EGW08_006560 [Elysia chlorotica]|uniref:Uncharacterized protein n=1 Tax=Elysia chlorotica TaxID=188477 RepID=A0A3S0ZSE0_ELYCH|nr:hypothetical protein EGW08_006560 [Elysia chlorotica]